MDVIGTVLQDDSRRRLAREVVQRAGFGRFRKLIDRAYAMLCSGMHPDRVTGILRTQTPRLPTHNPA